MWILSRLSCLLLFFFLPQECDKFILFKFLWGWTSHLELFVVTQLCTLKCAASFMSNWKWNVKNDFAMWQSITGAHFTWDTSQTDCHAPEMGADKPMWPKSWRRCSPHWDENAASHDRLPPGAKECLERLINLPIEICPVSCLIQILPAVHNGHSAQLPCFIFQLGRCLRSVTAVLVKWWHPSVFLWCVCSLYSKAGYGSWTAGMQERF